MKQLKLVRVTEYNGATLGVLLFDGSPELVTLEDPWRDNERMISCIPQGKYTIKRHKSPKFGNTFIVDNVPQRDHILFHAGNTHKDTHGCILLGLQFGKLNNAPAILASKSAFDKFMELMGTDLQAQLLIIDVYGGGRVH